LESPLKENVIFPIFTIQLGTNDTMFAKLIFMNGTEKDYSQSAKFNIELVLKNNYSTKYDSTGINFQSISEGVIN